MDRRLLTAWMLATAALALAPQAAAASRLPANYVPSPGSPPPGSRAIVVSERPPALPGGPTPPSDSPAGTTAGGISPNSTPPAPSGSGSDLQRPGTSKP